MPDDFDAVINTIAAKYSDLIMADNASKSANVPTPMARVSGAIREAMSAFPGHIIDEQGVVRKVLGALPITADGCVVGDGAALFHPNYEKQGVCGTWMSQQGTARFYFARGLVNDWKDVPLRECYSTREAAEAAKEEADGK